MRPREGRHVGVTTLALGWLDSSGQVEVEVEVGKRQAYQANSTEANRRPVSYQRLLFYLRLPSILWAIRRLFGPANNSSYHDLPAIFQSASYRRPKLRDISANLATTMWCPRHEFRLRFHGQRVVAQSRNRWLPKGKNITYGFVPASEIAASMAKVFRDSFTRWAQATGDLNLTETTYDDADIKVGFYKFGDGVMAVECGFSIIRLQPASNVTTGEIRLDATKFWALPSENDSLSWQQGILDLESALLPPMMVLQKAASMYMEGTLRMVLLYSRMKMESTISKPMAILNSCGVGAVCAEAGGEGGASWTEEQVDGCPST
ncbi:Metalloendoproteinase 2-MMP [Spatholobus suberectus]|nr:Metalloendoproteinase 2-MMP [Spatholobus suberectus]